MLEVILIEAFVLSIGSKPTGLTSSIQWRVNVDLSYIRDAIEDELGLSETRRPVGDTMLYQREKMLTA
ncbi:hypothetical protein EV198_0183 [Roseivirga ehrenbergii]|uniref:Uncharacterized protein n=1 Tax=Roseivirga ehrenbergii (strain DSM 102268 / JCM 13514 / KCTC 12282 / NCIMB 14502 / KMM 6017) TaxID=279360 RepID=A0A150X063_ROSEK|nr:hypothetical protein MB14_08760 [Roseivirga ehrenbergii]TCL13361.1 hypothetical protein EV198_0183 [Roseivirga ehrenbergii]